jgi:hypothetical protein
MTACDALIFRVLEAQSASYKRHYLFISFCDLNLKLTTALL